MLADLKFLQKWSTYVPLYWIVVYFIFFFAKTEGKLNSRVDKQKNELGRWKSRIVAIFLLFLTL